MTSPNLESQRNSKVLHKSYTAFLLRCWLEETNGEPVWRFALIQAGNIGSKRGFASLDEVVAHLQQFLTAFSHNFSGGKQL